ncbi:MAG TPA: ATP synthase F1 subunit gamma [Dehalococcoidales bacterium]|nr:MAG: ATP synthase F1 subunit gamma [Chloroflexi bacterium RBG_16_60_22]HJX12809.1 ATP synthase F1 subunit gamma [Dehalococcoidales bacterium]
MPDIRKVKRRIKGVQNIAKITRAMEMIAASKMRKAQERGLAGRPYSEKIQQVIADLAALPDIGLQHPLLQRRPVEKVAVVHVTPDRGLCGGLNANLNRRLAGFILEKKSAVSVVAVGRKGRDFSHRNGLEVSAEFIQIGDHPGFLETLPISRIIIDDYSKGEIDMVYISYAQFVSTIVQRPAMKQLLPVEPAVIPRAENVDYLYEPGAITVLGGLLPRFVEMQIYHAILESIASEQSARMVAMRNATDSANELIGDLTLLYNKARQEAITRDLLDITGGVAALE